MKRMVLASFLILLLGKAFAGNVSLVAVPTAWKLQNYIGDNVVIWYSPSPCTNGQLTLPSNATADDKDRLWSLIMAAKISGKKMQIYYDDSEVPSKCTITSFSLMPE